MGSWWLGVWVWHPWEIKQMSKDKMHLLLNISANQFTSNLPQRVAPSLYWYSCSSTCNPSLYAHFFNRYLGWIILFSRLIAPLHHVCGQWFKSKWGGWKISDGFQRPVKISQFTLRGPDSKSYQTLPETRSLLAFSCKQMWSAYPHLSPSFRQRHSIQNSFHNLRLSVTIWCPYRWCACVRAHRQYG